jgi:hypothetical protein
VANDPAGAKGGPGLVERVATTLARVYRGEGSTTRDRLVEYAGLNPDAVDTEGDARDAWYRVVSAARRQDRLPELIEAVLRESDNSEDPALLALREELRASATQAGEPIPTTEQISDPIAIVQATYDVLRRPRHASPSDLATLDDAIFALQSLSDNGLWTPPKTPASEPEPLAECVAAVQLYAELISAQPDRTQRVNPFAPDTLRPLREIASDGLVLMEAKHRLCLSLVSLLPRRA